MSLIAHVLYPNYEKISMVPKVRIELTTRGSSGHCSTTELLRQVVNFVVGKRVDAHFLAFPPLRNAEGARSVALTPLFSYGKVRYWRGLTWFLPNQVPIM
jgi:hypothetical protein